MTWNPLALATALQTVPEQNIDVTNNESALIINQEPRSLWPGMRKRRWATALLPSKAINKNGMSFPIPFPLLQTVGDDFSRRR